MISEHPLELKKAARILVLELHTCWTVCVALGKRGHTVRLNGGGDDVRLILESGLLVGLGAVATSADAKRLRTLRVTKSEMQGRESAHGQTNDMRGWNRKMI